MDAVGLILAEKEHEPFPWTTGVPLAVLLHAAIGAALVVSALGHPARFVAPRAVSVRLVQAGSLKGGAAVPAPPAEAQKPKILKPAEEPPPPPTEKAKLLPAKEEKKKLPAAAREASSAKSKSEQSAPPAPSAESRPGLPGAGGAGGNVGIGGATFDQPDFTNSSYIERMLVTIGMNWFKPAQSVPISPKVRFRIERDGTIADGEIERSSGLPYVDRAALRAVITSSPLPPLPSEFGGNHLGVHLIFE